MKILGLDSSGLVAGIAVLEDDVIKAEYNINNKKTHSTTLLPMLDQIKGMLGEELDSIDAIAVSAGPGSFTGLRIGSAAAKGLAMAWNKPIVPVPTVDALAMNMWGFDGVVCPIMDARRGQTYTGLYEFEKTGKDFALKTIKEQCAVSIEEILEVIDELGKRVVFLGDGVPVFADIIAEKLKTDYCFAPAGMNRQTGASVALLGATLFEQGIFEEAKEHSPEYLRMSQAERERMEQNNADS